MVFMELLFKLVPVLFAVVHTVKSCLADVCLDPFVMAPNGGKMTYKMNRKLLEFTVCHISQGTLCPEGIRNRNR